MSPQPTGKPAPFPPNFLALDIDLRDLAAHIKSINEANGWYDSARAFGDEIALLHSEVSEMYEGYRNNDWPNVSEEAADIFIRLVDTATRYGINLALAVQEKCQKNAKRGYHHGGKIV